VEEVVIAIPHRGRLALLVSQLHYPASRLFYKIGGNSEFGEEVMEEGMVVVDDVTSHIASSCDKDYTTTTTGSSSSSSSSSKKKKKKKLHVSLLHNPSHLEVVGCVAAGKTRAKMDERRKGKGKEGERDGDGGEVLCLQVHGDAAMSGQGCVAETISLSQLDGFTINGTVHLVVNNQARMMMMIEK